MSVRQSTRSQQIMAGATSMGWSGAGPRRRSATIGKCPGTCPWPRSEVWWVSHQAVALYEVAGVENVPATNGHDPRANVYG
jgi:hypothetical protein